MDEVDLGVPEPLLESLPDGSEDTVADMQQAVAGWEHRINDALDAAETDGERTEILTDAVELLEQRRGTYDDFVPELRAWGQSPIYAITWRTLCADLIEQLYEQGGEEIDREKHARLVEDGIHLSDVK